MEDVGAALVKDDGAVALSRHERPRALEEEAVEVVRGEGSPEATRDGRRVRHPRPASRLVLLLVEADAVDAGSFLPVGKGTRSRSSFFCAMCDVLELFSDLGETTRGVSLPVVAAHWRRHRGDEPDLRGETTFHSGSRPV